MHPVVLPFARLIGATFLAVAAAAFLPQAALAAAGSLAGEVLETKDAPPYTYLRLKTADGETWAAVPTSRAKKGDKVVVEGASTMTNFESKTLKRTFDKIVFGHLDEPGGAPAAAGPAPGKSAMGSMGGMSGNGAMGAMPGMAGGGSPHTGMAMPMPGSPAAAAAATPAAPIKVAKATGADGKTIAEVFGGRAALNGKPVAVRGKVVKVNHGVMGKTWLHLQDGTGTAADGTNDLVVTTLGDAAVGDVVMVKGKARADVDLGAGYTYRVLVEDADVSK
jgi:hypothetical protein